MASPALLLNTTFFFHNKSHHPLVSVPLLPHRRGRPQGKYGAHHCWHEIPCLPMMDSARKFYVRTKAKIHAGGEPDPVLQIQTLTRYPIQELSGKVVLVRFDSALLLRESTDGQIPSDNRAHLTIKYLYNAGARVLLVSDWGPSNTGVLSSVESVADYLSSVLHLKVVPETGIGHTQPKVEELERPEIRLLENLSKFREEPANCPIFTEKLSSGVDIFVNDAFSQSHKVLASTVGVARFCYASVAGFQFEEELSLVTEISKKTRQPYVAIIGGSNLVKKAAALHHLASICDGLVFAGRTAFQIMHALGFPVPSSYVECSAVEDASKIIRLAQNRNIPILFPKDFWCTNDFLPELCDLFPSNKILNGWTPIGLGPCALDEIFTFLSKSKKVLWIGPVEFNASRQDTLGASKLAAMLENLSRYGCDITIVGNAVCEVVMGTTSSISSYNIFKNASAVWRFLQQRVLPAVTSLDRAYPYELDWTAIFVDPTLPLIVDIGSGNGLFLMGMAARWTCSNFLGLEINKKLVRRCLDSVYQSGLKNGYFISTNATSTFRSIISSYPGDLVLVSIQCPDPDFNDEGNRWRMLQRGLIEAIIDLLAIDGKIFLQSDVEAVAIRMKELFTMYGKGRLVLDGRNDAECDEKGWLEENPFGVRSDWEQHVIDRGESMYRLMISKIATNKKCKNG